MTKHAAGRALIARQDLAHEVERANMTAAPSEPTHEFCDILGADGSRIPSDVMIAPLGRDDLQLCVIRDARAVAASLRSKARAEAAEQLNAQLEVRNRNLETFAHAAAHDLKSPLRAVANLISWIEEDLGAATEPCADHFRMVRQRLTHMEQLVDGLLLYARVGRCERVVEDFDPVPLIREVIEALEVPSGFRIDVPTVLPRARGVTRLFQRVIQNLLSNAIKHHDRPHGSISVSCTVGNQLEFSVVDDGPGVPPRYTEEIFGMFKRLSPGGAGVGLALARRIVADHAGRIWVEPAEPRGSKFTFTWPAASIR